MDRQSARPVRRRWHRPSVQRRLSAAASATDMFRRPRTRSLLPAVIGVSVGLHLVLLPLYLQTRDASDITQSADEGSYLKKVLEKERAKGITKELFHKITMPPPPPDPEQVVNSTLGQEIAGDISKTVGKLLDVDVRDKITARVSAGLKEELAEASKEIAEGRLSEEEIRNLMEDFKRKAHLKTVSALKEHREETQVQRAKMSVTEWYEDKVGQTLRRRIHYELWAPYHDIWPQVYGRSLCGFIWHWDYNEYCDNPGFGRKYEWLAKLVGAQIFDQENKFGGKPVGYGWTMLPGWPEPDRKQPEALLRMLGEIQGGQQHSSRVSWDKCVESYLNCFYPHRVADMQPQVDRLKALWAKAVKAAEAYQAVMDKDAPAGEARPAQQAAMAAIKDLAGEAGKLFVGGKIRGYVTVNRAVRSQVFRGPARDAAYRHFVDGIVKPLERIVLDMAQTEFKEGIIIRTREIDEAAKEFTETIAKLLREDIQRVLPKPRFDDLAFLTNDNPYKSLVTGQPSPPSEADIKADEEAMAKVLAEWPEADRSWPKARVPFIEQELNAHMDHVAARVVETLLEEGRLRHDFYRAVESVDYTDVVQQRLDARARAMAGRGQDLAKLTEDGVPDTSASIVALMFGAAKGHGASLEPVAAALAPAYVSPDRLERAVRASPPRLAPPPAGWGRQTQFEAKPVFKTPKGEAIPFLANFPQLDGDLTDWGRIRPLILAKSRHSPGPDESTPMYAAWNYQGFFFGYRVKNPAERFAFPRERSGVVSTTFSPDLGFSGVFAGDHLRLFFDTLDGRNRVRGEPHTQEFVIFPRGTEGNPDIPGVERIVPTTRDGTFELYQYWEIRTEMKAFPAQASLEQGPDGTGPYRVTRFDKDGYTTEAFIPRSLFKVPVFAPGWYIGFECMVAMGPQPTDSAGNRRFHGHVWADNQLGWYMMGKDSPANWGDLLMLGTDPRITIQDVTADGKGALALAVVPGHSYYITVKDPDRNVNLTAEDCVIVSAEVAGGHNDVEVFLLKETGKNTGTFSGYVNTQPGWGRQVQGTLECASGNEVRFGYVDFANAKGERNVVYEIRLPVVSSVMDVAGNRNGNARDNGNGNGNEGGGYSAVGTPK